MDRSIRRAGSTHQWIGNIHSLQKSGIVIHEFGEEIIAYTLVLKGWVKEKRAMFYAFLSSVGLVIFIVSSKLFW